MGRGRTNARGTKIYWRSSMMYYSSLGNTKVDLAYGPTPSDVNKTLPRYYNRSPLYIQGFWVNSSETLAGDYVLDFKLNGILAYRTDSFNGLASKRSFNVPIRTGAKVKVLFNDQYTINMEDLNNRGNNVCAYAYGYYYMMDNKIHYTSCYLGSFNNPSTYANNAIRTSPLLGINILFEDFNQVYITHAATCRNQPAPNPNSVLNIQIKEADGTVIASSETEATGTLTDYEEKIVRLLNPLWIKPGQYYNIQSKDLNGLNRIDPSVRIIGYRRETQGKYGFSGYSDFYDDSIGTNITQLIAFTTFNGEDYGTYWPLTRTIGLRGCASGGLIISRNELFINTITQRSDITNLTDLDLNNNTEKSTNWNRQPTSGYSSYLEYPNRYGMEAGAAGGTSGGDYYTRHIQQVVL